MALSDSRPTRRLCDVGAASPSRDGSPPMTRITLPTCRAPYPGGSRRVPVSIASPLTRPSPFPRRVGIRIFTFEACSGFTRVTARWIAQPPKAAFVTRLQPSQLPDQAARQLPEQSTTLRVEPSSTGDTRRRGARRVEDGRGGLGHAATLRFPSPLIKPDVRISRIRLSDWFHRAAHGGGRVRCVLPKQWAMADAPSNTDRRPSSPRGKASSEASGYAGVFQAHRQSPILGSVQSAPEARALSSASITRPQRSYGPLRLPSDPPPVRRGGCQPQSRRVSPDDPHHPSNVPCPVPRRIETGACVDCFPAHTAFPVSQAGRHPHLHFRGLLRLHARYGPLDCSTAQGGLCHEAPAQSVARPNRSSATGAIDNSPGGTLLHW